MSKGGTLTVRGESISTYKARANDDGAVAWSAVPCSPDIKMHIPKFDIEAVGAAEIESKVFGLIASAGIRQEILAIRELGRYVTCFLRMTAGDDVWDAVEVFLFDDEDRVAEIWAL
jgi:hypothetical protein